MMNRFQTAFSFHLRPYTLEHTRGDEDDDDELLARRFGNSNEVVKGAGGYVKTRFYVKISQAWRCKLTL